MLNYLSGSALQNSFTKVCWGSCLRSHRAAGWSSQLHETLHHAKSYLQLLSGAESAPWLVRNLFLLKGDSLLWKSLHMEIPSCSIKLKQSRDQTHNFFFAYFPTWNQEMLITALPIQNLLKSDANKTLKESKNHTSWRNIFQITGSPTSLF